MLQRGLAPALRGAPAPRQMQQQAAAAWRAVGAGWGAPSCVPWGSLAFSSSCCALQQQQQQQQLGRGFPSVDLRGQQRRARLPYFNPDDGPDSYHYWRDLWAKQQKPPRRPRPRVLPVYLEPEEQQALVEAAVAAGVPRELAEGGPRRHAPRLAAAVQAAGGRIPAQPAELAERVQALFSLERRVPGLDVRRIFKSNGFGILAATPSRVASQLHYLSKLLAASGVPAEAGLLMTAAPKPALMYPAGLVSRAKELPKLFESAGAPAPSDLLAHPFRASLLNRSASALATHMHATKARHGAAAAASMYRRLPQLLLYRPSTLRRKTRALGEALGLDPQQAARLVERSPRLLTFAPETLSAKLDSLAELLQCAPGPAAGEGEGEGEAGEQGAAEGAAEGGGRRLTELVLAQPSLLHKSPECLQGKLDLLQRLLQLESPEEAARLLREAPRLSVFGAERAAAAAEQLAALPPTSPLAPLAAQAPAVLRAAPQLLALGGGGRGLGARLQLLERLAALGPGWQRLVEQLAGNAGDAGAVLARASLAPRVQWLLQQQPPPEAPEGASLYELVVMRAARFDRRFRGFAAQQREQRAAREAAAAAAAAAASSSGA